MIPFNITVTAPVTDSRYNSLPRHCKAFEFVSNRAAVLFRVTIVVFLKDGCHSYLCGQAYPQTGHIWWPLWLCVNQFISGWKGYFLRTISMRFVSGEAKFGLFWNALKPTIGQYSGNGFEGVSFKLICSKEWLPDFGERWRGICIPRFHPRFNHSEKMTN